MYTAHESQVWMNFFMYSITASIQIYRGARKMLDTVSSVDRRVVDSK